MLNEGGFTYDTEQVDLATSTTETGADYKTINPNGYVPALLLYGGKVLTEGPAVVQYLADLVPEKRLAPSAGTMERYRLMEWLNFISTELHKGFGALFNPQTPDIWKDIVKTQLAQRFEYVNHRLDGKTWLMGEDFAVADAYLFTVLRWSKYSGIDLALWPALTAYLGRVAARPAVAATLKAEGLV